MRISAKGRYAMASLIFMARHYGTEKPVTINGIAEEMNISKIYLEQVFSLLKRGKIVSSTKGSQGGYRLMKKPADISAFDILVNIELSLMEWPEAVTEKSPEYDRALDACIYKPLETAITDTLKAVSLEDLLNAVNDEANSLMYYIWLIFLHLQ